MPFTILKTLREKIESLPGGGYMDADTRTRESTGMAREAVNGSGLMDTMETREWCRWMGRPGRGWWQR
jgi:hypothetical protein